MRLYPAWHNALYFMALLLIVVGMPLSHFLVSVGMIALGVNWLWEGRQLEKWRSFLRNPAALALFSVFLLHVLGVLWTEDVDYAVKDLRVKLPLLALPLILSTSSRLSDLQLKALRLLFAGALLVGSVISLVIYCGWTGLEVSDNRDLSPFISHIRFSLMIALAIFWLPEGLSKDSAAWKKGVFGAWILWFVVFLFLLQSLSGIIAFFVALWVLALRFWRSIPVKDLRWTGLLLVLLSPLIALWMGIGFYQRHFTLQQDVEHLDTHTPRGEPYINTLHDAQLENGHYVNVYIAPLELEQAWNERSSVRFDSPGKSGFGLQETLERFLTSKGLRKDRDGVYALSEAEIRAIENGVANVHYLSWSGPLIRVHQTLWEVENYRIGHNPQGHSFTQRLEYWKTGWYIYRENFLFGVGTGDVPTAFEQAYKDLGSPLETSFRLRGHNQYLTVAITFGTVGLIWFLVSLLLPFWVLPNARQSMFVVFFVVSAVSMLNEDTLETQMGATFYAFFASFFLFVHRPEASQTSR